MEENRHCSKFHKMIKTIPLPLVQFMDYTHKKQLIGIIELL